MTSPSLTIGLVGDGPAALAYREAVWQATGTAPAAAPVEALLSDAAISAVIVAAPAAGDADAVAAALDGGRHVLVDPSVIGGPAAINQEVVSARTGDGSLLVARPWRFHEVGRSLRDAVDAGDLGPPAFFQWVSEGDATRLAGASTSATHTVIGLDLALWLLGGQPARLFARPTGADGIAISIRFANGTNALLEHRPQLPAGGAGYGLAWLLGPRGEARWEQRADNLTIDQYGVNFVPLDFQPCYAAAIEHAIAYWRGDADLAAEASTTRELLAAAGAVRESLRRGEPVELRPDDGDSGR